MDKILLVDYYGTCDENGTPVGHSAKVLREYGELLNGNFEVDAAVSPCMVDEAENCFRNVIPLKYNINAGQTSKLIEKIKDKYKLLANIRRTLKAENYDIYWFIRTDFFLMLFLPFLRKGKNKKKVALIYQNRFGKGKKGALLDKIFRRGIRELQGIMYTQKSIEKIHSNMLYVPDYFYDDKKYKKYKNLPKKNKAVCLGTMNSYKLLEQLVSAFNRNGIQIDIVGFFYEKERVSKIKNIAGNNIYIEDTILSEDDYYRSLAEAKYSVLPYDMNQYQQRSSGVLLESIFLNTIVVAPEQLLKQNNVVGLGYQNIVELEEKEFFFKQVDMHNIRETYDKKKISEHITGFLDEIINAKDI